MLSVVEVISLWSDPRYKDYLPRGQQIESEWFDKFVASWNVARTITKDRRADVLGYLNGTFRHAVARNQDGSAVDDAANAIAKKKWTPNANEPLSLVSKVAFFLRPDRFVPVDRWARAGIKLFTPPGQAPADKTYKAYLTAFDKVYDGGHRAAIEQIATSRWAKDLARLAGCDQAILPSEPFTRKVLDNGLMRAGGRPL